MTPVILRTVSNVGFEVNPRTRSVYNFRSLCYRLLSSIRIHVQCGATPRILTWARCPTIPSGELTRISWADNSNDRVCKATAAEEGNILEFVEFAESERVGDTGTSDRLTRVCCLHNKHTVSISTMMTDAEKIPRDLLVRSSIGVQH